MTRVPGATASPEIGADEWKRKVHMNTFTSKRTITGAAALAAAGLMTAGFAAPAMAAERGDDTNVTESQSELSSQVGDLAGLSDVTGLGGITGLGQLGNLTDFGPISFDELGQVVSPITTGDVSNESPVVVAPGDIGSGNSTGDIGSGNAIGSGNDVQAPVGSGNETNVDLGGVSDVVDVDDTVGDVSGSVEDVSGTVGEVGDVSGSIDDVTGSVDGMVDDITGSVEDVTGSADDIVDDVTGSLDLGGLLD